MSNFEVKQQVRPESNIRQVNGLARGVGGKGSMTVGLVSLYANADMPDASDLEDGILAFNTTSGKLQIVVSGAWADVHA